MALNQQVFRNWRFATLAAIKAVANANDQTLCFCDETETLYKYDSTSGATGDDKYVLTTGAGGTTRWIGIAGKYTFAIPIIDYIEGLHVSNNSSDADHDIDIASGRVLDEDQTYNMVNSGTLTAAIDTTGANGRDASDTLDADTFYFVYLIEKSSDGTEAGFFSKSSTWAGVGTKPTGYDKGRCIMVVLTDGSANITPFDMPLMAGLSRWVYYKVDASVGDHNIQNAGTSSSWVDTTTNASNFVPPKATRQSLNVQAFKAGGSSLYPKAEVRPDGWTVDFPFGTRAGLNDSADPYINNFLVMPVASNRLVEYRVQLAGEAYAYIDVTGFEFTL